MRNREGSKRTFVTLLIVFLASIAAFILILWVTVFSSNKDDAASKAYIKPVSIYDAEKEILEASQKLEKESTAAAVIEGVNTAEKVVSLTFEGMADKTTMQEIVDLLNEHGMNATFFVPGINAAEDAETVNMIIKSKLRVGNYSLSATKNMDKLSQDKQIQDFCRSNVILRVISGKAPKLLKCNVTEYTDELLQSAYASGLESVVKSSNYLNYQSFSSYEMTLNYVNGLKKGSVISIKTEGPLDETEYDKPETDVTPAIDKQPGIDSQVEVIDEPKQLVTIVGWLLKALDETNYATVFADDLSSYGDNDFQMNFDTQKLENKGKLAKVNTKILTYKNLVSYSFRGVGDYNAIDDLLKLLDENDIKATFFVTGDEIIDNSDKIKKILDKGHAIGNGGMEQTDLTQKTFEEVCFNIYKCDKLLKDKYNIYTELFMPSYGKCNDTVREAASALGYEIVTYSKNPITDKDKSVDEIMTYFKKGLKRGDVIYFPLNYYDKLNDVVLKTYEKIKPLGCKVVSVDELYKNRYVYSGLTSTSGVQSASNKKPAVTTAQGKITTASQGKTAAALDYAGMIKSNSGKQAVLTDSLYTTQKAAVFTFRGISNEKVLDNILNTLESMGDSRATFFVTAAEIEKYPDRIKKIYSAGHEIGNGGVTTHSALEKMSTEDICKEIYKCDILLQKMGINTNCYMPGFGYPGGNVKEAVSAMSGYKNYELVTYSLAPIKDAYKGLGADAIINKYLPITTYKSLRRGEIVYFRMDSDVFSNDMELANLVRGVANNYVFNGYVSKCTGDGDNGKLLYQDSLMPLNYKITSVGEMQSQNEDLATGTMGTYELNQPDSAIAIDKNTYFTPTMIYTNFIAAMKDSGDEFTVLTDETKPFTLGRIDTKAQNVAFLTFDDWGGDPVVMSILDVLKKHNVQASFFVIAKNIDTNQEDLAKEQRVRVNPNLLRTIALGGNDVCSHTYFHSLVDIKDTKEDKTNLENEMVRAHASLSRVVGDLNEPKLYFRPPTLAVSKAGLTSVFQCGYKYVVSGDFSTHDYSMTSAQNLYSELVYGDDYAKIEQGSIIVMHMSDNAGYTAEALDKYLTYNESRPASERFAFAKLSDYLG